MIILSQILIYYYLQTISIGFAGLIASEFQSNWLIEPYRSEPIWLHILKIKIDAENWICPSSAGGANSNKQFYFVFITYYYQVAHSVLWLCGIQLWHYFQSEEAVSSKTDKSELHHVMELQDFLSSGVVSFVLKGTLIIKYNCVESIAVLYQIFRHFF